MKFLNIGADKAIMEGKSDVRARIIEYGKVVEEFHVHTIISNQAPVEIKIAPNVWIHPRTSWLKTLLTCGSIIKNKKIDVIVSPDPFAKAWVCIFFAFLYRKKLLLSVYGGNIFDLNWKKLSIFNRMYSWIGRIVFKYAHAIQTDGLETFGILKSKYGKKVFWKPMIPANIQDLLAIQKDNNSEKTNILYIGRLIEQKNIALLVKVIDGLKDHATFTIVGDGPLKHLLPMESIKYVPIQSRDEIVERFTEADMLILTSHYEGFARVMMEAAFSGTPVVTTRVSGVSPIIVNGTSGYILEQGDENGFMAAVKKLIENEEERKRMGHAIRVIAQTNLSTEMMIEKQSEVYNYLSSLSSLS